MGPRDPPVGPAPTPSVNTIADATREAAAAHPGRTARPRAFRHETLGANVTLTPG